MQHFWDLKYIFHVALDLLFHGRVPPLYEDYSIKRSGHAEERFPLRERTLFSRIILQEVRGDGFDIFLGSPSVVYNEDRSEDHSQKKKGIAVRHRLKQRKVCRFSSEIARCEFLLSNGTMSIKAAITDHLEMFFRDVPDKAFDKIHDRNGFLNVLIIFVTIVMERDKITGIRIDPGSGNIATKIPANIFGNNLRVTTVGLVIKQVKPCSCSR